ncbi:MAG: hypothetical protein ABEJ56_05595 [Candidatus Nanohaloarchaea archaeon]
MPKIKNWSRIENPTDALEWHHDDRPNDLPKENRRGKFYLRRTPPKGRWKLTGFTINGEPVADEYVENKEEGRKKAVRMMRRNP